MNPQGHWEKIYREKAADAVSWYRSHLETSLELIERAAANPHWSTTCSPEDLRTLLCLTFRKRPLT